MTAPQPPEPPALDPIVSFTHKLRDRADIVIAGHRAAILVILTLGAFATYEGWKWHLAKMARLEVEAASLTTAAKNEAAVGDAWHKRAIALGDSIKHDTVRVRQIITHTRTVLVPATPPGAQDGVSYSVPLPLEPVPMVARADFDSLGAACSRVEHDCAAHSAAQDSALAHLQAQRDALYKQIATDEKARKSERRANTLEKIGLAALLLYKLF